MFLNHDLYLFRTTADCKYIINFFEECKSLLRSTL